MLTLYSLRYQGTSFGYDPFGKRIPEELLFDISSALGRCIALKSRNLAFRVQSVFVCHPCRDPAERLENKERCIPECL